MIYGIITDKVIGILPFDSAYVDAIPYADSNTVIDSLYKINNETIFIINIYSVENLLKKHQEWAKVEIPKLFPQDETSKAIMAKRTLEVVNKSTMKLASSELHVKNKYISFNLNSNTYCIALDYVKEVLKDTSITNVPGTPDFIEWIMNLRGDYITVINLKNFLDLEAGIVAEKKPVIIIKCNELKLALLIDKINELFEFQQDDINDLSDGYFSNEFIYNNTLYTILNVEKIASDKRIIITDM